MQSATVSEQSLKRCTLPCSYSKHLKTSIIFNLFIQITGFHFNTTELSPSFKLPSPLILLYSSSVQRKTIMNFIFFLPHKEPKASPTELLSLSQC